MLLNARLIDGADPRPDLILLTISDITELEEARYELEGQKEYSEKIVDSIREALLVLDWDLRVKHANQPLPNQSSFDDFEVEHDFESIGHRTMLLNARRLDHLNLILLAIEDVTEREQSHRRQEILSRELSHRVKNILTLVDVLANQTAAGASSLDQFLGAFHGRIKALARAHGQWLASEWTGGDLRELVLETLDACCMKDERVRIEGAPVRVTSDQTMALNLSLHELCTNAAKYGAFSVPDGRLQVNWSTEEVGGSKQVRLLWKESGGPTVKPPTHTGFGKELIERLCPHELSGEAELKYEPSGLECVLVFPLKQP